MMNDARAVRPAWTRQENQKPDQKAEACAILTRLALQIAQTHLNAADTIRKLRSPRRTNKYDCGQRLYSVDHHHQQRKKMMDRFDFDGGIFRFVNFTRPTIDHPPRRVR
uniref:Uncharacterized protein n=1 Tax=Plectus sambesii TaxID=2011161 RepID=A0A914VV23_9BILA